VLLLEREGAPLLLPAPPPLPGLAPELFEGERVGVLLRDEAAFARLVERRSASPAHAIPADATLVPLPMREAAARVLALAGPVVGAVLDPGAKDAFRIARWELRRLARGEVLAARDQDGKAPERVSLAAACREVAPDAPPPEALARRFARIGAQDPEVAALYLFERRPVERAQRRHAKLCLGAVLTSVTTIPAPLVKRVFGEAVVDLIAPDEPLLVRRIAFVELEKGGLFRGIAPIYRASGLGWRTLLAKGLASIVNGIFAPREPPR